jgi:ubiquinone/menaquinone biosynthesis C-methylase UbiE
MSATELPDSLEIDETRRYWDTKSADWIAQADRMAQSAGAFNEMLLGAAGIAPGQRVLDLASGPGEPALTIAARVGPEGLAVASDLAPGMLAGLRRRARTLDSAARLLHCVGADMQRLPFADGAFDRVVCRFGIMFVPDPIRALQSVRRVLKPGGRTAFMAWGPRAHQAMFPLLAGAVESVTGQAPDAHHFQIFRFGDPGSLAAVFRDAGFGHVRETDHRFSSPAPGDVPFWRTQLAMGFGHVLGEEPAVETLAALDDEVRRRLAPLRERDGYRLTSHMRIVTGTKLKDR